MVIFRLYLYKNLQHLTERCNQPRSTIKSRNGVKTNQDINSFKRWRRAFASNIRPYLVTTDFELKFVYQIIMKIILPFPQVFDFILERKKIQFCLDKEILQ